MSMTGLESFDTSLQKANIWLKEIMEELAIDSRRRAYGVLRAVLHTLRDRLTIDEAADLGAQLPMIVRGIYYDEWKPSRNPIKDRHLDDFLQRVRHNFHADGELEMEDITKAVFHLLKRKVTEGEIEDIRGMMPKELLELWQ